jgi:hypothetical protein
MTHAKDLDRAVLRDQSLMITTQKLPMIFKEVSTVKSVDRLVVAYPTIFRQSTAGPARVGIRLVGETVIPSSSAPKATTHAESDGTSSPHWPIRFSPTPSWPASNQGAPTRLRR